MIKFLSKQRSLQQNNRYLNQLTTTCLYMRLFFGSDILKRGALKRTPLFMLQR